jgi:hypothetical protein
MNVMPLVFTQLHTFREAHVQTCVVTVLTKQPKYLELRMADLQIIYDLPIYSHNLKHSMDITTISLKSVEWQSRFYEFCP